MEYYEYHFTIKPKEEYQDIVMAFLEQLPFETFIELEDELLAYIPTDFNEQDLNEVLDNPALENVDIQYHRNTIQDKNWNEEWEKDFPAILVNDEIYIKADFHPDRPEIPYIIHIQPKMAFGTGHHSTTYLMLEQMLDMDFQDKKVLDMGSGTAILGIFAKIRGASYVKAIDIDVWAYENAIENAAKNSVEIDAKQGDASLLGNQKFNVILANINKNILLEDIPKYVEVLEKEGQLLLSGLLDVDFDDINILCIENGLKFVHKKQKNEWISILYQK